MFRVMLLCFVMGLVGCSKLSAHLDCYGTKDQCNKAQLAADKFTALGWPIVTITRQGDALAAKRVVENSMSFSNDCYLNGKPVKGVYMPNIDFICVDSDLDAPTTVCALYHELGHRLGFGHHPASGHYMNKNLSSDGQCNIGGAND